MSQKLSEFQKMPVFVQTLFIDDKEYQNYYGNNPRLVKNLVGGTRVIRLEVWNEELEQYCPFEKTIVIPIEEVKTKEICPGECSTLT